MLPGSTMTDEGFEAALALARQRRVETDSGAGPQLSRALENVARAAPNPPQRLIDEARLAFRQQQHPI